MTRITFLKKYILKFAIALALLGLIVYVLAHALGFFSGSLHTMPVRTITERNITSAPAYLFRDERVLYANGEGLIELLAESGSKVGKNVSVARFYGSALSGDALESAQRAVDGITRMIRILEQSEPDASTPMSQANAFRAEAKKNYLFIRDAIVSGDVGELGDLEETFLILLNRYMVLSEQEIDVAGSLAELKAQRAALLGSAYTEIKNVDDGVERSSGTFYDRSYVDGYEGAYTLAALEALDADGLAQLQASSPAGTGRAIGKMVYGYSWYLAVPIDSALAASLTVGSTYEASFPQNGDAMMSLTLERICEGETESILVLRADDTPSGFDYYRTQTVVITLDTCNGFYIPESAMRTRLTSDGEEIPGVYVFENSTVRFRRIDILYRGDGYCIAARPGEASATELAENDILITSGKNLYDGKVYQ